MILYLSNLINPTSFYQGLVKGQYKPSTSRGFGDLDKYSAGEGGFRSINSNNTLSSSISTNISAMVMTPMPW